MRTETFNPFLILMVFCFVTSITGELRWCKPVNASVNPALVDWVRYDDEYQTCIKCSDISTILVNKTSTDRYECCGGLVLNAGICGANLKESGSDCSKTTRCDGEKQCVAGEDEVGCRQCRNTNSFSCLHDYQHIDSNADPCVDKSKVCDSVKDCRYGLDETGCEWHEGWCVGFLCKKPHARCILLSQVCDGIKHCADGSDEHNCQYCDDQFRCMVIQKNDSGITGNTRTTAECVGSFRVCDGERDCSNGLDERNCFRWLEWSSWSECNPPDVCTRTRTRKCIPAHDSSSKEVSVENCYNVEDYHQRNGKRLLESHNETCPRCRPNQPTPITQDATITQLAAIGTPQRSNMPTTKFSISEIHDGPTASTQEDKDTLSTSSTKQIHTSPIAFKSTTLVLTTTTEESQKATIFKNFTDEILSTEDAAQSKTSFNSPIVTNYEVTVDTSTKTTTKGSPSPVSLAIILSATIVAGSLLLTMICCLVFCFTEKRYKTGKWTPRKLLKNQKIKVPDMYYDIPIEEAGTMSKDLPTNSRPTECHVMSTFSGLNSVRSGIDSGIDANSTSSGEGEPHEHHLTTDFMTTPYQQRKKKVRIAEEKDEFPPPPQQLTS